MNKELKEAILKNRQKTSSLDGWYIIDPTFAKILLDLNENNYRSLDKNKVHKYACDMKINKWCKNGETIVVGSGGVLQDGQHRLHAIITSGVTIECFIIFDADKTKLYDLGKPRTVNQMFNANGITAGYTSIATGRLLLYYGTGREDYGTAYLYDYVMQHLDKFKAAESIVSVSRGSVCKKAACSVIAYCMLQTGEISETDMREFFTVANSGNTFGCFKDASSALVLRKQLMEQIRGGGHNQQKAQLEITYRALLDFKNGVSRKRFYDDNSDDAYRLVKSIYQADISPEPLAA